MISQAVPSRIRLKAGGQQQNAIQSRTKLPSDVYGAKVPLDDITLIISPTSGETLENLKPEQIGVGRPVEISSGKRGRLIRNPDGTSLRMIALKSAGAVQIRVHLQNLDLADGDSVFLYGVSPNSHVVGPLTGRGPFGDGDFWTDSIEGDTVIIEQYTRT
ncbi:MAG: hypothetical protein ACREDR_47285, partial [Blastocatellia bacterium]